MNNKNWYDEVKEDFIKNINDSYTLNLAVSVLEDRKELLNENLKLQQELQQKEDIINKANNFIKEYEKNRNCFKWNEEDYIDVINEIKQILDNKGE